MSLKNKFLALSICFIASCSSKTPEKVLSFSEQIEVDTVRAQSLYQEFQKEVTFVSLPATEKYLTGIALKLVKPIKEYQIQKLNVKVHQDTSPDRSRFFSFPGTVLSIPQSFLKKVEFENELAAALAFEMANVIKRTLANRVENNNLVKPVLFGPGSFFDLERDERTESIELAVKLLYYAHYDTRGMPSIFQRYPQYYIKTDASDLFKKELAFNIREAQKAKSEYLPTLKPIVRSDEFIQFKKELK